jgi:tetratricopeptide (TPR) repeat protein
MMERAMRSLIALVLLCATAAAAEPDVEAQARAHFRAATTAHERGDYARAIDEYQAAYALLPLPELLFNLGQVTRLHGDIAAAADYYRRYLAQQPTGAGADEARNHLREVEAILHPAPPPAPPPPTRPAARPARRWLWPVVAGSLGVAVGLGVGLGVGFGVSRPASAPTVAGTDGTFRPF